MYKYITTTGYEFSTQAPLVEVECVWCGKLFAAETGSRSHQYPQCGGCFLERLVPAACGHYTSKQPCIVCTEKARHNG